MITHAATEILLVAATLALLIFLVMPGIREIWYLAGMRLWWRRVRKRKVGGDR